MGRGRCLRPVRAGLCSGLCSEGGPSAPAFPACVLLPSSGSHTVTGVLCRGKRPKWGPEWPVQEWGRGARATHPRGSLPWEAGWPQRDTGGPSSGPGALVPGEAVRTLARGGRRRSFRKQMWAVLQGWPGALGVSARCCSLMGCAIK